MKKSMKSRKMKKMKKSSITTYHAKHPPLCFGSFNRHRTNGSIPRCTIFSPSFHDSTAISVKVSSHQLVEKWGFCSKASDDHNFEGFLRIVPGLKTRKFLNLGMRPCRQKFLPLLDHRNFWTFKIFSNFFSKKSISRDFDDRFFQWRGAGGQKFLSDVIPID